MSDILNIIDDAIDEFERAVEKLPRVRADKLGLDSRAGYVYIDTDNELIIAKDNYVRTLEYYGGFEYIDDDATTSFGDFKVYSTEYDEDGRVARCVDFYLEHEE